MTATQSHALLFEDFPKNHNLVLIGRPSLLAALDLTVNHDIKSRVTYSVITKRLGPDAMRDFLLRIWNMGFAALGRFGEYILIGAVVVIPVFLILRILSYRR